MEKKGKVRRERRGVNGGSQSEHEELQRGSKCLPATVLLGLQHQSAAGPQPEHCIV